ncbi:MAG TPA: hypothetical protein VNS55_05340 [Nocardioides sp.]|nr:hypothetical protein [Nocardioides sp.]
MLNSHQPVRTRLLVLLAAFVAGTTALLAVEPSPAGASGGGSPVVVASNQGTMRAPVVYRSADGWFRGRFTPSSFEVVGDQLVAHGTVSGLLHKAGDRTRHVAEAVSLPVQTEQMSVAAARTLGGGSGVMAAGATCDVLNLVLGPLDLNLLGLEVHLDQVVLDILANPAGGLLGDLLCAVANLLDSGPLAGLLGQLADLLNQILGVLSTV